jgi:putative ABC transport system permease protein
VDEILASADNVSFFLLKLPERADRQRVRDRIERRIGDVHAMDRGTLAEHDQGLMAEVMETPLMVMLGISMVIGTAVLGLTSYTAALERMPDYAVLKAIGASPGHMRSWLLWEGVYRALLGYAVGGTASMGAARLIETLWPKFTIVITSNHFVLAAFLLVIMVAIGSLLPLRRVQRLDPAVVFRA